MLLGLCSLYKVSDFFCFGVGAGCFLMCFLGF